MRFRTVIAGWMGVAIVLPSAVSCSGSSPQGHDRSASSAVGARTAGPRPQLSTRPARAAAGVPSPSAPPFGYCGGLRTVADARYITSGGEAVALVEATVDGAPSAAPGVSRIVRRVPVDHVHVLAGRLTEGRLRRIDSLPLPRATYLFVVGDPGPTGDYFTSLGMYGVFVVRGQHAYRTCYDYSGSPPHQVRAGVSTVAGLTHLFALALR